MEETPLVSGRLVSSCACITDQRMARELERRGYGDSEGGGLILKQFEALYLLYANRLILKSGRREVGFDAYMTMCQKGDPGTLTKFLIYRDLRSRGYVVRDGFGFGMDFRVYEKGDYMQKGAKILVFGLSEGQQVKMGMLQKKIDGITRMGKEPIVAVIERRGEVIYYRINKIEFHQNRNPEESFEI